MATIIAASLQLQRQANEAVEQLILAGFAPEKVSSFFINPPGQHALYPIGGDQYQSPSSADKAGKHTKIEDTFVGIAEAVIGVMHENHAADHKTASHRAGMLVAVEVTDKSHQEQAAALLTQLGGHDLEQADGEIVDGDWIDFDPLSEPHYLSPH